MSTVEKRTISLPKQQADYVDSLVARGDYGSVSEVVRAGLRELRARDARIEKWLREEVVPAYDRMKADPSRLRTSEQVRDALIEHARKLQIGDE